MCRAINFYGPPDHEQSHRKAEDQLFVLRQAVHRQNIQQTGNRHNGEGEGGREGEPL